MQFVFTCNPAQADLTLYEFRRAEETFSFVRWLAEGVGLAQTALSAAELADCVRAVPVIFVRHLFAVCEALENPCSVSELAAACVPHLAKEKTVCVQTRSAGEGEAVSTAALAESLAQSGFAVNPVGGEQIVSVFSAENKTFLGVGNVVENLTHRSGGMMHFARTAPYGFVSRAEFKLREAVECFEISLGGISRAADLGAAPGGWTKVLAEKGIRVTAIDPSRLNPAVLRLPNVEYKQMLAEEYLKEPAEDMFDLVVNDMKLDVHQSVRVMNAFHPRLSENALAVMTFKLPHSFSYRDIWSGIRALRGYALIGARQLFHNRSEITVVLRRTERPQRGEHPLQEDRSLRAEKQKKPQKLSKKLAKKYKT